MEYEIIGTPLPAVVCHLKKGDVMLSDSGAMAWMDPCMEMGTTSNGGIGKAFGRMFSGETMFLNTYTANADGKIAFASSFPGEIRKYDIEPGKEIVVQKSAFLASEPTVERSIFFNKKAMTGIFGGEGFFNTVITGPGHVVLQTMPISAIAGSLAQFFPSGK